MTFHDLNLNKNLLEALDSMGIITPTSIQEKAFNVIMSGKDVIGIAQTGTGKTYAYLLPCLRLWKYSKDRFPQVLIVVPTRELVAQVVDEIQKLSVNTNLEAIGVYGGTNLNKQAAQISAGCDVVVATPGRLLDLCLHGALKLKNIKRFVIDEVDEMLNLGFLPQLKRVFEFLPKKRQNLLFSATMIDSVEAIIEQYFNFPVKIEAAPVGTPLENIDQTVYKVANFNTKVNLLTHLLRDEAVYNKVLVFTGTKKMADMIFEIIEEEFGVSTGVIHSNKSQNFRFNAVHSFTSGEYRILIATDIVARGIDVSDVSHVINFDIPEVPENYIHRIGRTGRADRNGNSISFCTEDEKESLTQIEELMNYPIPVVDFPSEVEVSEELIFDEIPQINMKTIPFKHKLDPEAGGAFHEKSDKNKKVNNPIRRKEAMKIKYKKAKTRGQKRKGK